jgi:hypothetical protein
MRDIDEFLPEVLIFAPNCPEPLALKSIREAARDLCHNARLWRDYATVRLTAPDYVGIGTTTDAEIVDIEMAEAFDENGGGAHRIEPVTVAWLNNFKPGWTDSESTSSASYVFQLNPNTVSVFPRQAGSLRLKLVLQPSLVAEVLPDWLFDLHRTAIGRGAASKVLTTPGENSNPQLGAAMWTEFVGKIASLRTEFTKGQQGARLRTSANWF